MRIRPIDIFIGQTLVETENVHRDPTMGAGAGMDTTYGTTGMAGTQGTTGNTAGREMGVGQQQLSEQSATQPGKASMMDKIIGIFS